MRVKYLCIFFHLRFEETCCILSLALTEERMKFYYERKGCFGLLRRFGYDCYYPLAEGKLRLRSDLLLH